MQIELTLLLFTTLCMLLYLIYDLRNIKIDKEVQQVVDNLNDDLEAAIRNAIESRIQQNIVNALNGVMDEYVAKGLLDSEPTRSEKYLAEVGVNNKPFINFRGGESWTNRGLRN